MRFEIGDRVYHHGYEAIGVIMNIEEVTPTYSIYTINFDTPHNLYRQYGYRAEGSYLELHEPAKRGIYLASPIFILEG